MPQRKKYTVDQSCWMIFTTVYNVWRPLSYNFCHLIIWKIRLPNRLQSFCMEPALGICQKSLTKYHDPADVSMYHHFPNMISLSTKGGGSIVHPLMSAGDTNGYNWGHTYMTSALERVPYKQMKEREVP